MELLATPLKSIDCLFCNFPWGKNLFEYYNETEKMLLSICSNEIPSGCECVFVTKKRINDDLLIKCGLSISNRHEILIGGKDIKLRNEKERSYNEKLFDDNYSRNLDDESDLENKGGDCIITFTYKK